MYRNILSGLLLTLFLPLHPAVAGPLETRAAEMISMPHEVWLDSRVEAVQQATVSAQTAGQVEELLFDVGDFVEKDSLIIRLKDTEQRAQLAKAEAAVNEVRAGLKKSADEHRRIKDLFARKLVSSADMDQSTSALKAAEARVAQTEAGLKQAREQLEYTQVRAPYSGIVIKRHAEVGEVAQPGKPLITGISLDRLRTLVALPQSLVSRVRVKASARVELPDGATVAGTKVTVFPIADHGSNTFMVRVELPRGVSGLFPGMFVKTAFLLGEQERLAIPRQALAHRGEVTGVYVRGQAGKLSFRHIRTGKPLTEGRIAVLAGLDAGEQVALDPISAGVALKSQRGTADGD